MIKIEITNSFCKDEVVSEIITRIILAIAVGVIILVANVFKEKNITFFIILLIVVIATIFLGIILSLFKNSAILRNDYYIVEDVLIYVFKNWKYHSIKGYTTLLYNVKFSKNGEYKIAFYSKDGAGASKGDYGIVRNSEPGDKVYLVMSNKNKILQCYNAKDYTISEDDFELRDGKYYLWGSKMADPVE